MTVHVRERSRRRACRSKARMGRAKTANPLVLLFERGLRPPNPAWGEVRKGGDAPLRV